MHLLILSFWSNIQSIMYGEVTFDTKEKWSYKDRWPLKKGLIDIKCSMTGQEKMWPFTTGDCLIEVTT